MWAVKEVWWQNLRDQFRTQLKKEKSGSGGDQPAKKIAWQFYREMSFMKRFMYSRRYTTEIDVHIKQYIEAEITNIGS